MTTSETLPKGTDGKGLSERTYTPELSRLDGHGQTHAGAFFQHVKDDTVEMAKSAANEAQHKLSDAKSYAKDSLKSLEREVSAKPVQSVAIAFATGAIVSLLLSRR